MKRFPPNYRFQPAEIEKIKKIWPRGKNMRELEAFFGKTYNWVRRFVELHRVPVEKTYAGGETWAIRRVLQLGRRGRGVTLPANFCQGLNLHIGDQLLMERKGKSIVVRKLRRKKLKTRSKVEERPDKQKGSRHKRG